MVVISVPTSLVTLICWICEIMTDIVAYWILQMKEGIIYVSACLVHFCLTYFYDLLLDTNTVRNISLLAPFLFY